MMLNEQEQKIFDLGWAVGFMVGEGSFTASVSKRGNLSFSISITQKELEPLIFTKNILVCWGIKEESITIGQREEARNINVLRLNYSGFSDFIKLLDLIPLHSPKREKEVRHFKQVWEGHKSEKLLKQLAILEKMKKECGVENERI
jgi:hypothetical protein